MLNDPSFATIFLFTISHFYVPLLFNGASNKLLLVHDQFPRLFCDPFSREQSEKYVCSYLGIELMTFCGLQYFAWFSSDVFRAERKEIWTLNNVDQTIVPLKSSEICAFQMVFNPYSCLENLERFALYFLSVPVWN